MGYRDNQAVNDPMKRTTDSAKMPQLSAKDVAENVDKAEVIYLRLSLAEKESVKLAASSLRLSTTEYLLRCHALVAAKLPASDSSK